MEAIAGRPEKTALAFITKLAVDECHDLKRAMDSDYVVFIYLKRAGGLELNDPFVLQIFSADLFAADSFTDGEDIFEPGYCMLSGDPNWLIH